MSILSLLLILIITIGIALVIRAMVRTLRSPLRATKFPVFSIFMLSISLALLVIGTLMSIFISDALGGAIAAIGGVAGTIESQVRHKRESLTQKVE
jgi:hypothetical protein